MCSAYGYLEILRDFTLASRSLFDHFPVLKGKVSTLSWLMFIYRNLLYLISTACSCRPNLEDGAAVFPASFPEFFTAKERAALSFNSLCFQNEVYGLTFTLIRISSRCRFAF